DSARVRYMRFARRWLTLAVYIAPLVALGWLAYRAVGRYVNMAERDLAPVVADELTRALGHEVRIGKVRIEGDQAYVDDVHVALGATFLDRNGAELARA